MYFNNNVKKTLFNVRLDIWICFFLVISILCIYWQVRHFSFVNYDDPQYVTANYAVQTGLAFENIRWAFTAVHANNWHPLTWLSHMLDCQIYGLNPGRHHLTNVLFHILNTVLLFFIFRRMTGALFKSAFVAALFALHPLHVESVAWIAERKDVLSTFFLMLTLWSYTRYVEHSGFDKYLLLILFYILGLMAKPMLVTLPFVLLLLDYWPLKRFCFGSSDSNGQRSFYWGLVWEKMPLFILSVASSVVTYLVQKSSGAVDSLAVIQFNVRIANALVSCVSYIGKMLWPHNLAVLYPYRQIIFWWQVVGAGLFLMMISVFIFRMRRSKPYLLVGWLWYIGTLVPVIGIVQVGSQAMVDRYTYVPLIGIFIMAAWGGADLVTKWRFRKIGFSIISTMILAIFMITSWLQIGYWSNSVTLFEHAINITDDNGTAQFNLGKALAEQNKIDAEKHYNEALRINPNDAKVYNNLGVLMASQNKKNEAVDLFNKALHIDPSYAGAYYNLDKIFVNEGRIEEAIFNYRKALSLNKDMIQILYHLSWILASHENVKYRNGKEAVKLAEKLCEVTRNIQPLALDALAAAYAETGRFNEAVLTAKKALNLTSKQGFETLALYLKKRLDLYRNRRPYHQAFPVGENG